MRRTMLILTLVGALAALLLAVPAGAQDATYDVDTILDTPDANIGDGICADATTACSLRAAVQEANATTGVVQVNLDGTATYAFLLAGAGEDAAATGDLDVTGSIELVADGATINAATLDRVFQVIAGGTLSVTDAVLTGGLVTDASGGAIASAGTLTVTGGEITGNIAEGMGASGGAIFNDGGSATVTGTEITLNQATRAGGGIEANAGTTSLDGVTLSDNVTGPTPGNGGAFHLTGDGDVTVANSTVTGNTAAAEGGGLWNSAVGTMTVTNTTLTGNSAAGADADQGGGALFNDGGTLTATGVTIEANSATGASGSGGGILNNMGTLTVSTSTLTDNTAVRAGGGIEANVGTTNLDQVDLTGNMTGSTPGNGGAFHLTGAGTVTVTNSTVTGNTADAEGGGLWNSAVGTMTVTDTMLTGNSAAGADPDQGGGALFNDGGTLTATGLTIEGNSATGASGSGGGILNNMGTLSIANSSLVANTASRAGGGIEANVGTTEVDTVAFTDNHTGDAPGNGGAIHLSGAGTVTVAGSAVTGNTAANEGGGLWNSGPGTMTVTTTTFAQNEAPVGIDVFNVGGAFTIDGVDIGAGGGRVFADVPSSSIFFVDVLRFGDTRVTRGCNPPINTNYCPQDDVSRGQMAAFLTRALNLAPATTDYFVDDEGTTFEADINALAAAGVTVGCNPPANDRYCPGDQVTRAQMASFLVRAYDLTAGAGSDLFTDDDASVHETNIDILGTAGVTRGCNPPANDRYCPYENVRRDQMAAFLNRAMNLSG